MNQEVFKPVRGTEASILATTPQKGYVYFAIDTRKIYYSDGESFLPMGGNTGVWYGTMEYGETPDESLVEFNFEVTDLEGNSEDEYHLPNVDDLIFNTPDGCFYRVIEIEEAVDALPNIKCYKLTVAGSGTGGGGGGGSNVGLMTLTRLGESTINTLQGNTCYIRFNFSAVDAAGLVTGPGTASIYTHNTLLQEVLLIEQGENAIDVSKYLENGINSVRLVVSGDIGGSSNITQSKTWTIISTNLAITWNYDETTINTEDNFVFRWTVSTTLAHTIHIDIDNYVDVISNEYNTSGSRDKVYTVQRSAVGLLHGSHTVKMYATTEIGGVKFTSAAVIHHIICVDEGYSDTIISVGDIPSEMTLYDTISIPLIFYNPLNSDGLFSAILYEDGVEIDRWINYNNSTLYTWNYTPVTSGLKILTITSGTTEAVIRLRVQDLGLNIEEVPGYDFKFKASDLTSNNSLLNWSYNNGAIVPTFSEDFDWVNGGFKSDEQDENGNTRNYVAIKAGNRLSFNYKPFAKANSSFLANGFSIKIIFKAIECRSYDANILTIGTPGEDTVYFLLKANEGIYQAMGASVKIPYCEDSYIELELDLWPYGNGTEAYLMSWLNGVPASVSTYSSSSFFLLGNARNIIIGSDNCDVLLYMIKIYQNHLSNELHLSNFIMDAPNAMEIINRYNRNNILDDNGEISYNKLIEKNPECDVYLYEIPRITTTKKDKVKNCTYLRYKGSTTPLQTADGVTMAVLGTSSAAYGLAAFNFNSTFENGFIDYTKNPDGEHIDNWAMDENAIPINDYNTKVNVASCEGVNNALNQEWYDKFVNYVYTTEFKKKNPKSRHTMLFMNMGVVFLKDNNLVVSNTNGVENNVFNDTEGYVNNPYYKLYSICNMGNIKRNEGVFSDPDNPYDVIMENSDNLSIYLQMTGGLTLDGLSMRGAWEGDKFFPLNLQDVYEKTSDKKAIANKDYYIRTGNSEPYIYTLVLDIIVDETDVSNYYELHEAGTIASTEVFEWRTLPACWEEMGDRGTAMRQEAENAWLSLVAWFARNNPNAATGEDLAETETYGSYTFKGYTSRNDRLDKNGNAMAAYTPTNQILKGLTISKYAGEYTKDTYERRMAKMLSECEDYLIMDEIVFHYLFIERHTLIDNVAKNTFWHTEDLLHWSMIKDYDNDTSDGNDNSGHLTLTYGYETLDHIDYDNSKSMVFNAATSSWLHFIEGLYDARVRVYLALDSGDIGAWDAEPYLEAFDNWLSKLPERVWIEDYYRKYLRPNKVYGATLFLPMLEGGKKTFQRKQYEVYQEAYMSSEYFGRKCQNSIIDIRANGSNIASMTFPMTMYTNCYIRIAAGSGHDPNVRERYFRGLIANIRLPVTGDANDMTTYFYLAHYVTSLKNIELLKPKKVDISAAYRITEFSMKSLDTEAYYIKTNDETINNNKTYYKGKYEPVSNPTAEDFDTYYIESGGNYVNAADEGYTFQETGWTYFRFTGYEEVLEPNQAEILNYYELLNSNLNLNLTKASFDKNRMLEKLEVVNCPNVTDSLDLTTAKNLKYLNILGSGFSAIIIADSAPIETILLNDPLSLKFDNLSKIETFSIGNNNLAILNLNNIDNSIGINSKTLVNSVLSGKWINYNLLNVIWTISDSSELNIDENNLSIPILDTLLSVLETRSLSGTLTITQAAYNGNRSLDVYNKYSVDTLYNFPNLDIQFTGSNAKLYEVIIKNGNGEVAWKRKTKGNYTITNEFLSDGPYGAFDLVETIKKADTESHRFLFTNSWKVINIDNDTETTINGDNPLIDTNLNANLIIEPIFNELIRLYLITFIDGNGDTISSNSYDYGTLILNILPNKTPEKDDSELDIYKTYTFLGYALSSNAVTPIKFSDSNKVNNTYTYYAVFSGETSVNDSINVNYDNFDFSETINYQDINTSFNLFGYRIKPKTGKTLTGKVTIPAIYNELPIVSIGNFSNQTEITGIFFEEGSLVKEISATAFKYESSATTKIKYFEIPDSLRVIRDNCFWNCNLLFIPKDSEKASTDYFIKGANLYSLGDHAFDNCLDPACETLYIGSNITRMGSLAIENLNNSTNLTKIVIGTSAEPTLLENLNASLKPLKFNEGIPPISSVEIHISQALYDRYMAMSGFSFNIVFNMTADNYAASNKVIVYRY